ncbi:MAG: winged helix-turn-helix transcriptional regulator [Candidatus Dadabacteria bacterium]
METRIKDTTCPVGSAIDAFGGKWKPDIIYYLRQSPRRFNELRRLIPRVTQRMLTQQLRELERDGLVNRKQFMEIPPKVVYSLSDLGLSLVPVFDILEEWGARNIGSIEKARARYDSSLKSRA